MTPPAERGWRSVAAAGALFVLARASAAALAACTVCGVVRDAQGLAVASATVRLLEAGSAGGRDVATDGRGRYDLGQVEPGRYELRISAPGFRTFARSLEVRGSERVEVDATLDVAGSTEEVVVRADSPGPRAAASELIDRAELARIPGALRAGSRAAILATTPSAVMAHDQLHVRGGHEVGYEIDGVPIPSNTIGSNLGLLFDPKDVKAIEIRETEYSAAFGDRLHGQVNVVTRSGFEQPRALEAMVLAGQQRALDGAVSYGDHSDRLAFFAQASANRTDFGITPPSLPARHDRAWSGGGAGKIWAPLGAGSLLTLTATARANDFQVPQGPDGAAGLVQADRQAERDVFAAAQWHHAGPGDWTWSVTPYYHFNRLTLGPATASPAASRDDRRIHYLGSRAEAVNTRGVHRIRAGTSVLAAIFGDRFVLPAPDRSSDTLSGPVAVGKTGLMQAGYIEDLVRPSAAIAFTAGLRVEQSRAYRVESAVEPRAQLSVSLPGTPITVRLGAGRFFVPPPIEALGVGGAQADGLGEQAFLLVRGQRTTQWEAGVSAALPGTTVEVRYYRDRTRHFLDHEQLGDSAVFLPVNLAEARLQGLETVVSSRWGARLRGRLVYALGFAQARGGITGGLGDIAAPETTNGYYYLDHDQRHTAAATVEWLPTARSWATLSIRYGSGLALADHTGHLPPHTTGDLSLGFAPRRHWSVAFEVENLTDARYFVNLSSEFNGTHVGQPRTATGRLRLSF